MGTFGAGRVVSSLLHFKWLSVSSPTAASLDLHGP